METLHLLKSKKNADRLFESIEQIKQRISQEAKISGEMKTVTFSKNAWEEYTDWQKTDKKILLKINELIKDINRTPFEGLGKPEPLKFELAGYWSRRISLGASISLPGN